MLKELIIEMWLGIKSPSKLFVPSLAKTKVGKRFYCRENIKMHNEWREFLKQKYKEDPESPIWNWLDINALID
jgi:hypothetical protein